MPEQVKAQAASIKKTGRPMVYSLSPGGTDIGANGTEAAHAKEINADVNMYRVTGDDWDSWGAVESHFAVAHSFSGAGLIGAAGLLGKSWPDLDMLPFGVITSPNSGKGPYKNTTLTHAQQYTQMTLWAMAKSPLMFGGDATQLDAFTAALLTNEAVLKIDSASFFNKQVDFESGSHAVWVARDNGGATFAALFNLASAAAPVSSALRALGLVDVETCHAVDVWTGKVHPQAKSGELQADVDADGVVLLQLTNCK
jgi:hypothetical protein